MSSKSSNAAHQSQNPLGPVNLVMTMVSSLTLFLSVKLKLNRLPRIEGEHSNLNQREQTKARANEDDEKEKHSQWMGHSPSSSNCCLDSSPSIILSSQPGLLYQSECELAYYYILWKSYTDWIYYGKTADNQVRGVSRCASRRECRRL